MSISSIILPGLTDRPTSVARILSTLKTTSLLINSSTVELTLLSKKAINYVQSRDEYLRWTGCHLIKIISVNPIVISNHGADFITSLMKLINIGTVSQLVYQTATNTILSLCLIIKGKQSLTREVLTPNLPGFINTLVKKLDLKDPQLLTNSVSILTILIRNHSTIFRPHATAYESKLMGVMKSKEFRSWEPVARKQIIESFVALSLVNKAASLQWSVVLKSVMEEFQSVFKMIFQTLLQPNEDAESDIINLIELLKLSLHDAESNMHNKSQFSLAPLSIDLNDLKTTGDLFDRIALLTDLIIGFITTPLNDTIVNYPIGKFVNIGELLINVSAQIHGFQKDLLIGDINLKHNLNFTFSKIQLQGIKLLNQLVKVLGKQSLGYFEKFTVFTELVIPMKTISVINPTTNKTVAKKILDVEQIKFHKFDMLVLLEFVGNLLKALDTGNLHDFSFILKLVDMTSLMVEEASYKDVIEKTKKPAADGSNKRTKKSKNSVELSDFIADASTLKIKTDVKLTTQVLQFYSTVLKNIPSLSVTQLTKVQHFVILSAMRKIYTAGNITNDIRQVLENFVVYQNTNEKYNLLPIIMNIMRQSGDDNNQLLSLLLNPRFPISNKREIEHYDKEQDEDLEIDECKIEEAKKPQIDLEELKRELREEVTNEVTEKLTREFEERESKRRKLSERLQTAEIETNPNVWTQQKFQKVEISKDVLPNDKEISSSEQRMVTETVVEVTTETKKTEDHDDENNSDFEIPDIEMDSSDEE
ncbi:hypothetical protein DASC09_008900 [Saccharomycopsis crataegensis]|uniref:Pre-rRNA-processing protein RIX1 n=1 Tax=Saccharomycopsis crataegensis TaxID=43959 RepID=A0AAV5QF40_9ASCO|nr:hypothetical protein DASC09_008900 [Saccharomycopsis crataegensis]